MPEMSCSGGALFDMDGDGDLDVYLVQSGSLTSKENPGGGNRLFRNNGDGDFEDVTEGSGTDDRGYGMGVAAGDYDNDGDVDLYVTNVGPDVLLRNEGNGHFIDVTLAAGLGDPSWGSSAGFIDYDADGDLDLFLLNYMNWSIENELECYNAHGTLDYCGPTNYNAAARDTLYRNNGDGTFTDVTTAAGFDAAFGYGLGVAYGDFNSDGHLDIFVSNDSVMNQLWISQGDGTFKDEALFRGCALDESGMAKAGMGIHASDVDDDGDLDVLLVNLLDEADSFYRNEGDYFADQTAAWGMGLASRPFTRFGVGLVDFDNNGYLDVYQSNGGVAMSSESPTDDPFAQENMLFRGAENGRFSEVLPRGGTSNRLIHTSRAAVFGDINNDGAVDILVVNRDGPVYLLKNIVKDRGNWIRFRVIEEHGRDALGATVTLKLGSRNIRREVQSTYSYLAANDPRVHIGLGDHDTVSAVKVHWLDGTTELFGNFEAGQTIVLERSKGTN
ncbi:MAG: CRTAC1 family protein [Planctomycetes bacterium]|nr:CRTAC1 family protein [Planctomycetota bacterium]